MVGAAKQLSGVAISTLGKGEGKAIFSLDDEGRLVELNKYRFRLNDPRPLGNTLSKYTTGRYTQYDVGFNNVGTKIDEFKKFSQFDNYSLFMNTNVTDISQIPKYGVRLDDRTIMFIVQNTLWFDRQVWIADFDKKGMVRASRGPLGNAAILYCRAGDQDLDGNILTEDQAGWYYAWYKGIHLLCGEEGRHLYMVRPSHEHEYSCTLGFRVSHRAIVQPEAPVDV